ncbi:alpha/beta fold hydrolase [Candidatus Enterococcus clewellii]|uniref:AB hydrolase-1 domain-containing protein n=1 Tax=Candidatus Enterococcus clewellii TaxID=1834193 RepID=A0A242K818_9ENTE|nr:alpha/beta hydrolase [Enterococcus sp. 9E7_DIV0242]OTP17311.1 hypothetical protein A5888_001449 [Enterococcus sp. 9E7_DIV0242]
MEQEFFIQTAPDIKINSLLAGNKTSSQLIILLHGGPGSGYAPLREIPAFKELELSYLCLYFDQRSSGKSLFPADKKMTKKDLVNDVYQIIRFVEKKYPQKELWLFGGSFGGYLALQTIREHPNCVKGLLLSCPAVFFSSTHAAAIFQKRQQHYIEHLSEPFNKKFSALRTLDPKEFFDHPEVKRYILSSTNTSKSLRYSLQISDWFFSDHLAGVFLSTTIPTCIIQGIDDPICSEKEISHQLKVERNSFISYHALENCGHAPFQEQPDQFLQILKTFIKENTSC